MKTRAFRVVAFAYSNGLIGFGNETPQDALPIVSVPSRQGRRLRGVVEVLARYAYPSKPGASDGGLLVPGIPESPNQNEALNALLRFNQEVRKRIGPKKRKVSK